MFKNFDVFEDKKPVDEVKNAKLLQEKIQISC